MSNGNLRVRPWWRGFSPQHWTDWAVTRSRAIRSWVAVITPWSAVSIVLLKESQTATSSVPAATSPLTMRLFMSWAPVTSASLSGLRLK